VLVLLIFITQEPEMADFVKVANTNEIEPGQARLVDVQIVRRPGRPLVHFFQRVGGFLSHKFMRVSLANPDCVQVGP
jgi:hypothetical protein